MLRTKSKKIVEIEINGVKLSNTFEVLQHIGKQEERIKELEAQIEKMKCCGNCENRYGQEKCADCHKYSKWKFKQAEQFYEESAE